MTVHVQDCRTDINETRMFVGNIIPIPTDTFNKFGFFF